MYDWFELLLPSSSERVRAKAREERSEGIATRVTAVVTVTKMHLKVHSASILNYDFQFDICVKEKKRKKEIRLFFYNCELEGHISRELLKQDKK